MKKNIVQENNVYDSSFIQYLGFLTNKTTILFYYVYLYTYRATRFPIHVFSIRFVFYMICPDNKNIRVEISIEMILHKNVPIKPNKLKFCEDNWMQ